MAKILKPMPVARRTRIGNLTTVTMVGVELARLYRKVRKGEVGSADGSRMATILLGLKACLETALLEKRMLEIETALSKAESSGFKPRIVS
jgi:hypothetical protein